MPLEALLSALERDALAEAEARLERAREDAAQIRADADARAERLRAERRRQVAAEHERATAGTLAAASRAARARALEAEEALLEAVHHRARERLARLELARWRHAVAPLLEAGLRYAGTGSVTVRCHSAAVAMVRDATAERSDVTLLPDDAAPAGITLARTDGTLRVRLTLPDRLEALWPELRSRVAAAVEVEP